MRSNPAGIRLSATDLSNHLACRHLTSVNLSVARGQRSAPDWRSPDLFVIQELGLRHEAAYLNFLREQGMAVADLRAIETEQQALLETRSCMERGIDVIAQGSLALGRWFGRPDVLRKVPKPSRLGAWSYEVYDCKLARETKATTILQLALYSTILAGIQGEEPEHSPEFMYVVPPGAGFKVEAYRLAEYAAYYRYVRARLEKVCDHEVEDTYPEPCAHCEVCRWFRECDERRRADDHLSLVAGIRRQQRSQLEAWDSRTVAKLAALPIPLQQKPLHGSREGMERVREQARVQVEGRAGHKPVHELLGIDSGTGFCKLPEPSRGDVFVDLEGDPFAGDLESGDGQEYLFGLASADETGKLFYEKYWAFTPAEEKKGFEWLVDHVIRHWVEFPMMHLFHFGHYEKDRMSKLAGRYATREEEIDRMLRAELFVDLHAVLKQAVRASVEEYSLKKLEVFYGFERKTALDESRVAMRYVEHRLELGWEGEKLQEKYREVLEGYNWEDCLSTAALRDWLEGERQKLVNTGLVIARPEPKDGAPSERLKERQARVAPLVKQLCDGIPADPRVRSEEQSARWLLAQLLDWHRREDRRAWQEGYRLADLDDEALTDERVGLAGLCFKERLGVDRKIPTDRYIFGQKKTDLRVGKDLYDAGQKFGEVKAIDCVEGVIDIKKTKKTADIHPSSVYMWDAPIGTDPQADSLFRTGEWVRDHGLGGGGRIRAALDLLLRRHPNLAVGETIGALPGEDTKATASRIAAALRESVFAIQGPPGTGKTFTGARMICRLVRAGKKVGITALSHKVIRKLLDEVILAASEDNVPNVRCMQRITSIAAEDVSIEIAIARDNETALEALQTGKANVLGGTSWLWAAAESFEVIDALFVDEAGQMALADVIAAGQAAKNLFLIGDPQQLQRPLQGSHPEGAEKSALEHLLRQQKTISPNQGMLLPQTRRMHPNVCEFTSEMFYERKLAAHPVTYPQGLDGHLWLHKPGLYFVAVNHEGNRNSSPEEVEVVARIVASLLAPTVRWFRSAGNSRPIDLKDILIVAPYNAQVSDLLARLPGAQAGTVDKFQGQEAPVVIYSLTTSSPEDAPRGMEFLYSLNRFNVATSRAMSNVIVVGNPRLFEPECRSPRQMQLANAFCRFAEIAQLVDTRKL